MNWLDFIFIGVVLSGTFIGLRIGLIGATLTVTGVITGALLAGQFSDDISVAFGSSIRNDTLLTVISYVFIILLTLVATRIVIYVVHKIISILLLRFADKLGGAAAGAIAGLIVCWVLTICLTRLAYDFEIPTTTLPTIVAERIPSNLETIQTLENALLDSTMIPVFVSLSNSLPASAFGIIPADFMDAFNILDQRIQNLPQ